MTRVSTSILVLTAMAMALGLSIAPTTQAANWNVNGDGDWSVAGNWNPSGVPTLSTPVEMRRPDNSATPFIISLTENSFAQRIRGGDGTFWTTVPVSATIAMNGFNLTLDTAGGQGIEYGASAFSTGGVSITFDGGGTITSNHLRMSHRDDGSANTGFLNLSNGTVLQLTGGTTQNSWIGESGLAEVHITGGSSLTNGQRFFIGGSGPDSLSNGSLYVQGDNSSYTGTNVTDIGGVASTTGLVEVSGGGSFTSNFTSIAGGDGATGTVLVTGSGTTFTAGGLQLGADRSNFSELQTGTGANRTALLSITAGASATAAQLNVRGTQSVVALNGSTLNVTGSNSGTLGGHAAFFVADSTLQMTLENAIATPAGLNVTNGLQISGAVLDILLSGTFSAAVNDVFTLAEYGSLTGTFKDLPNLSTFTVDVYEFQIDYGSGTNDAITLTTTVIPEPSTALLLGAVGLGLCCVRRRKQ